MMPYEQSPLLSARSESQKAVRDGSVFLKEEKSRNLSIRNLSIQNAVYNLIGTIVGGGLLSLSDAFAQAGIIPSTMMMFFSAGTSIFCMKLLCHCAQRSGTTHTYAQVVRISFGKKAELITSIVYSFFLCLVLVGYMILIKEIWTPLFYCLIPPLRLWAEESKARQTNASDYFLFILLLCMFPMMLKKDLHSLRHANYASFLALLVLVIAIVDKVCQHTTTLDSKARLNWWSEDFSDWVFAFPITGLSFFCISNLLPMYERLIDPSDERITVVLNSSVGLCFIIFYMIAISGYLYAGEKTRDNILLNFDVNFDFITLGRLCFGLMLIFVLPLNLLPCRDSFLSLPFLFKNLYISDETTIIDSITNDKATTMENDQDTTSSSSSVFEDTTIYISTVAILLVSYILSVIVPGVGILWAFCGSSMSLLFGFCIPCLCYLKLCVSNTHFANVRAVSAILIAIFSFVASVICTIQIVSDAGIMEKKLR